MSKFIEVTSAQNAQSVIKIDSVVAISKSLNGSADIKLMGGFELNDNRPYDQVVRLIFGIDAID